MAKAIDSSKHILAGLLILSFLLLILVASRQFMQPVTEVHDKKEGFKTAPTRAAECKCLPGYVPSNSSTFMRNVLLYGFAQCNTYDCSQMTWHILVVDIESWNGKSADEYFLNIYANKDMQFDGVSGGTSWQEGRELFEKIKSHIKKDNFPFLRYFELFQNGILQKLGRNYRGTLNASEFISKYMSNKNNGYVCQSLSDQSDTQQCY